MKNNILLTGAQGLVGSRFVELYKDFYNLYYPTIDEFNLLDSKLMKKYLRNINLDAIINFAAYTDVSEAEKERGNKNKMCWRVNVDGVYNLTRIASNHSRYFIHISTDMIYSGSRKDPGPYDETQKFVDHPDDLSWYGYTKGLGERVVKDQMKDFSILRITYPVRAKYDYKLDYLRKPLKLYNENILYPLFDDQIISITYIDEACNVLDKLLKGRYRGVFHCSSNNTTSPYELVKYLIEAKYAVKDAVKHQSINNYLKITKNPLRYPIYGGLNIRFTSNILNIKFLSWKEIVDRLIKQGISV